TADLLICSQLLYPSATLIPGLGGLLIQQVTRTWHLDCFSCFAPASKPRKRETTTTGFEPVRAEPSRFLVYPLNHSGKLPGKVIDLSLPLSSSPVAEWTLHRWDCTDTNRVRVPAVDLACA